MLLTAAGHAATLDSGNWQNQRERSALTDVESTYWWIQSETEHRNAIGLPEYPRLEVMCHQNETRVIFDFNDYMGLEPSRLTYRIDQGAIESRRVDVSQDGTVIGLWNGTGIPLLKELAGSSKFVVSARPWAEGDKEAVFEVQGIDNVLSDVRKYCGW